MRESGIRHGSVKYEQLRHFLNDPTNSPYLQLYYLLCAGYMDNDEVIKKTQDLIDELTFLYAGHYSYRKLFQLDGEWYEYFKENAWPTGQRRTTRDERRGVDREEVDTIMRIKKGPPPVNLENAMIMLYHDRYKHIRNK